MPPSVERASTDDLDAVLDLWVALAREQREHGSALAADANREAMGQTLAALHQDDGVFVARSADSAIVGFATVAPDRGALETDVDRALLSNIYVRPPRRGEGIGSALLTAVEDHCRDRGIEVLGLEVLADNERAREFYRDRGYDPRRLRLERSLESSDSSDE